LLKEENNMAETDPKGGTPIGFPVEEKKDRETDERVEYQTGGKDKQDDLMNNPAIQEPHKAIKVVEKKK
jgi:hypothetical protein